MFSNFDYTRSYFYLIHSERVEKRISVYIYLLITNKRKAKIMQFPPMRCCLNRSLNVYSSDGFSEIPRYFVVYIILRAFSGQDLSGDGCHINFIGFSCCQLLRGQTASVLRTQFNVRVFALLFSLFYFIVFFFKKVRETPEISLISWPCT